MGASCTKEAGTLTDEIAESTHSIARTSLDGNGILTVAISSSNPQGHPSRQTGARNENADGSGDAPSETTSKSKRSSKRLKLLGRIKSSKLNQNENTKPSFIHFSLLSDDVILCILSFVSYAPTELDISGTLTLSMLENPSFSYKNLPEINEGQRLIHDYNVRAGKLDKALSKRTNSVSPFWSPQCYINETFHSQQDKSEKKKQSAILGRVVSTRTFGTLTHVLPLVSKRMYRLCSEYDILWKESLQRLLLRRSWYSEGDFNDLFERGIISYIKGMCDDVESNSDDNFKDAQPDTQTDDKNQCDRAQVVISKVCLLAKEKYKSEECSLPVNSHAALPSKDGGGMARHISREVLINHKPQRLPVFVAPYRILLGKPIELRLYEYRYQLLIAELMVGRPDRERRGFPISEPRPRFLFCCRPHMELPAACIVEVRQCLLRHDGTADVMLMPLRWVLLETMAVRPDSGSLRDAIVAQQVTRIRLPVFHMRHAVALGRPMNLRFFEPRYQMMVAELMTGRPDSERDGSEMSQPRPHFVYACTNPLDAGSTACIAEVRQCHIYQDGIADATIVPSCWVLIEQLAVRPYFQGLVDANVLIPS